MAKLRFKLLGEFGLHSDGSEIRNLSGKKAQALLAYLALMPERPQPREKLATLLWGTGSDVRARHSLSQALTSIRKVLTVAGADCLDGDAENVVLHNAESDAADFERLAKENQTKAWDRAVALYDGALLEGLSIAEEGYMEWLDLERRRLEELAIGLLCRLLESENVADRPQTIIGRANRLLTIDALNETAHRALMRTYAGQGQTNAAIRQYQHCATLLAEQLGTEPDAATRALHDEILSRARAQPLVAAPSRVEDRPSVAVLPFAAFSRDPEHRYVADAVTDDIISGLARLPGFFVIASNSCFAYKGESPDVREVGRELGVRYVVEGSLRKVGDRIRINVQLVETERGTHLWTDRFEGSAERLADLQDDVARGIVAQLEPELTRAEVHVAQQKRSNDLQAWSLYRQAHGALILTGWSDQSFRKAAACLRRAIELDPDFALAHAYLALVLGVGQRLLIMEHEDYAREEAQTAVRLDPTSSDVLGIAGCALTDIGDIDRGLDLLHRAVEANPSNAQGWAGLGTGFIRAGQAETGVRKLEHGIRISPKDQRLSVWRTMLSVGLTLLGRYEDALEQANTACREDVNYFVARIQKAIAQAHTGDNEGAKRSLATAREIRPSLSDTQIRNIFGAKYSKPLFAANANETE